MSKKIMLAVAIFALSLLVACSKAPDPVTNTPTLESSPTSTTIPTPETGKATVSGRVLDKVTNEPIFNRIMRLAEVHRGETGGGIYVLDSGRSPGTRTDAQGYFVFNNINASEYTIVVGDPEVNSDYVVIPDENCRQQPASLGDFIRSAAMWPACARRHLAGCLRRCRMDECRQPTHHGG